MNMEGKTVICHQCVGEKYVKSVIKAQGTTEYPCSYCERKRTSMPIYAISALMHQVFKGYYEPENAEYYFGFNGGDTAQIIISQELIVDEDVAQDIYDELCKNHNPRHANEGVNYSDEFTYSSRQFSLDRLNRAWEKMKGSLCEEARFFNSSVKEFLDDLFSDLDDFRIDNSQSPINTLTQGNRLYRARVFESKQEAVDALRHPERNFGPPPPSLARSGRMNAQGISVFYGATTPDVAISEVRPPVGSFVIVAPFEPRKELRILDISALDALVFSKQSVFHPDTIKILEKTAFLKTFSHKMTLPVFGKRQDDEYLITQAIAEYLSVSQDYKLDGISFRSTQVKNERQSRGRKNDNGYNVVLFSKSSGVMYSAENERTYQVSLMDQLDEDSDYFVSSIHLLENEHEIISSWQHSTLKKKDESLELIVSGLNYFYIQGVSYQKRKTHIQQGKPVKRRSESLRQVKVDRF